ncbi:MAG: MBL fold metallo-hydrolase [Dehalococcoidia bacterium]
MEIIPGIHQIKVPMGIPNSPLGFTNTYLVRGDAGWTLIDTGWNAKGSFEAFESQMRDIGLDFKDIKLIVVTHVHPDHYGLSGRLKQLSGAELAVHKAEMAFIDSRYLWTDILLHDIGEWLHQHGVPDSVLPDLRQASMGVLNLVVPAVPERVLLGGETISTGNFNLKVILTPGHSPGHICLYEPSAKVLFSGDHILPETSPNISLHVQSKGNPLGDYIRSLKSVREIDVELVLPAHENIFTNLPKRVDELLKHHQKRTAAILDRIKVEPKTAYQIASEIPWGLDIGGIAWKDLRNVDKRLAVMEALAHLEALRIENRVLKSSKEGIVFYKTAA